MGPQLTSPTYGEGSFFRPPHEISHWPRKNCSSRKAGANLSGLWHNARPRAQPIRSKFSGAIYRQHWLR